MAVNSLLFPPDFPSTLPGVSTEESAIDDAVTSLQKQARDAAVKQAHTRRISGQGAIANQNRQMAAFNRQMPLTQVGAQIQAPAFVGTAAYLGGGRGYGSTYDSMYQLLFSNESLNPLSIRLTTARTYGATNSEVSAGWFIGGHDVAAASFVGSLDKFTYLKGEIYRIASQLVSPRVAPVGGLGDKTKGFVMGGVLESTQAPTRQSERLTYATDAISNLGSLLPVARFSPHNGTCNKFSGYIYGGSVGAFGGNVLLSIDRLTFSSEAATTIGTTLGHAHVVHAASSSSVKGYLSGGNTNPPASWNWFTDTITAFTYSGEISAPLAAKLVEPKVCHDGTGSSVAGYFVGGDTPTSNWQGTKTVDKLTYANEANTRIGATLESPQSDQGAISDYGPGFSD